MPTYVMLTTLTPDGVQTIKNNPQRIREVNKEIEQLGAIVKAQWATLRRVRLHQHRRGTRRGDDGARVARARLARDRSLRDARRDPGGRLHRLALRREGPRRRRRRPRARDRATRWRARRRRPELLCAPGNPGIARDARLSRHRRRRHRGDRGGRRAEARRPRRRRARGSARRGPRRCAERRRHHGIRADRRGGAAGGLEGVRQGGHGAAGIPTAAFGGLDTVDEGMAAIAERYPVVIKFDGLAAGKGVDRRRQDEAGARALRELRRGAALRRRRRVVVEEHLVGRSCRCWPCATACRAIAMAPAQDFKRIFDGDEGPNTGGMGSYSPVPGCGGHRRIVARRAPAGRRRARAPRHPVSRRPLRRADADRRRPTGARVQHALRRPRDPGRAAAPARRPARAAPLHATRGRATGSTRRSMGRACRGHRRAGQPRLPRVVVVGRRHHRRRAMPAGHRGHARRHRAPRRRGAGHRRRARAQRHRARRRSRAARERRVCWRAVDRRSRAQLRGDRARAHGAPSPGRSDSLASWFEQARAAKSAGSARDWSDQRGRLHRGRRRYRGGGERGARDRRARASGSSWARSPTWRRWRRRARLDEPASATRSASCRPTATPSIVAEYCKNARMRGLRVIIAGAGLSAALPGVAPRTPTCR